MAAEVPSSFLQSAQATPFDLARPSSQTIPDHLSVDVVDIATLLQIVVVLLEKETFCLPLFQ